MQRILALRKMAVKSILPEPNGDRPSQIFVEISEGDQQEWIQTLMEMYGDEWPLVDHSSPNFAGNKIFLTDVSPGNISLRS